MFNIKNFLKGLRLLPKTVLESDKKGEIEVSDTDGKLNYHDGTTRSPVVTESHTATVTNKTVDADNNTISNLETDNLKAGVLNTSTTMAGATDTQVPSALAIKTYVDDSVAGKDEASEISYDNATSGLTATDVQAAIDEVEGRVDTAETGISDHLADAVDAHDASAISNIPAGNLAATDVQGALNELQTDIDTRALASDLSDHLSDAVDAHDASAISYVNTTSGLTATEVQSAIDEVEGRLDTAESNITTNATNLSDHLADATDAHDASAISNVPSGNLAATDVQSALNELQTDIDTRALSSDLTTHTSATSAHGVSGDLVGTTDTQTLTNKTIQGASIESPTRLDPKKDTLANLTVYATTAQNGELVFSTDTKQAFQVVDGTLAAIGGGVSDVDILEVVESFDSSSGLTTVGSGIHGQTQRLTHDSVSNVYAEKDIALDDKFRNKQLELLIDIKTTASSGNLKVIVTDTTNSKTLADEVLTPQDVGAKTSKRRVTFSTTPADGDLDIVNINVEVRGLPESGSPTSDFDDLVIQLSKTEVREIVAIEQEENVFSARITNNGTVALVSQSYPFIDSIARTSLGIVEITLKSGFFTQAPSVVPSMNESGATYDSDIQVASTSTSTVVIHCLNEAGSFVDRNFHVIIQRQGSDYRDLTRRVEREVSTFKEVVVEEADSAVQVDQANGYGSSATCIPRFLNLIENYGSDITYIDSATNGASFTINTDGIYNISYTAMFGPSSSTFAITKNDNQLSTDINSLSTSRSSIVLANAQTVTGNQGATTSCTVYLKAGDVIRPHTTGVSLNGSAANNKFTISKVGVPKIASVAPDSKIEIPTSELRFEGTTGKGTGAEAFTVAFQTLSKIKGDALSVSNSNGTIITVLKDGMMTVNADARVGGTLRFGISKNTADASTYPLNGEMIINEDNRGASANDQTSVNGSFQVKVGDVIRVWSDGSILSTSANGRLEITHQEQKIQVAVSNVTPQYEDVDSMVRLTGSTAGNGTTNTQVRRFDNVISNIGSAINYVPSSTLGDKFVIAKSGFYSVNYSNRNNLANDSFGIVLNPTTFTDIYSFPRSEVLAFSGNSVTINRDSISWSGILTEGDEVYVIVAAGMEDTAEDVFTISKVGVPSIAEVDVTPFADVNRKETLYYRATSLGGRGSINTAIPYWTKVQNLEGANDIGLVENNSTNGFSFTALKDCTVTLQWHGNWNSQYVNGISINSTQLTTDYYLINEVNKVAGQVGPIQAGAEIGVTASVKMKAGDVLRPHTQTTASVTTANRSAITLTAEADSRTTMYSVAQTENEFSARISNNGTAAIVSESSSFIDSVVRTSLGYVRVNFKAGFFSEIPKITLSSITAYSQNTISVKKSDLSLSGFTVEVYANGISAHVDDDFTIHVSRQGADRQDLQKAIVQLNEFPRVNRTISQEISFTSQHAGFGSSWTDVKRFSGSPIIVGDSIMKYVADSTFGDYFEALKDCEINITWGGIYYSTSSGTVSFAKNQVGAIPTASERLGGSAQSHSVATLPVSHSANALLKKGDKIRLNAQAANYVSNGEVVRLNARAQDLEVITNIDQHENVFSARISATGSPAVTSQSYPFIQSISSGGTGIVTVTFKSNFFSQIPSIQATSENGTGRIVALDGAPTTSQVTFRTTTENGTLENANFTFTAKRQGDDYKSIQDVVAQVFTPKVAYLKDVKPSGTEGGTFTSGSYQTRTLNVVEGNSEIVSLSTNQLTLNSGKYEFEATVPGFGCYNHKSKLRNITDSTDTIIGSVERAENADGTSTVSIIKGQFILTSTKVFEIQHQCSVTKATNGFGKAASFGDSEVYTQVKITKIY